MNIEINKTDLLRGLRLARGIADVRSTLPMLANVLVKAADGVVTLTATDLAVSVRAECPARVATGGEAVFAARALHDLIANAPGESIAMTVAANGWAEIRSGKVRYKLAGGAGKEFPRTAEPPAKWHAVDAAGFAGLLDRTLFSACQDENRFQLCGVFLEAAKRTLRAVSTDGHRLTMAMAEMGLPLASGIILPRKGALEIRKVLDSETVEIAIQSGALFVRAGGVTIAAKLIDAQFPPYEQVIPKDHKRRVTVDRARIIEALRRCALMSTETRGVKLACSADGVTLTSHNPDLGETSEGIDAEFAGEPVAIGFNPKYVLELLATMDADAVTIDLGGELDPAIVRPFGATDHLGVIMPMRVG